MSEAVFTTNLLRLIRQDRLDIDGIAAHLRGAAPPDKHGESARFMEALLAEVLQTLKSLAPLAKPTEQVNEESERAKRKLQAAGLDSTPPAKRRQSPAADPARASTDAPTPFPVVPEQTPCRGHFVQSSDRETTFGLPECYGQVAKSPPSTIQRANCAFKKHVAEVRNVLQNSSASKAEYVSVQPSMA